MTIEIPADFSPVVAQLISAGRFRNEGEVVVEGLRLVAQKEALRVDVAAGISELDAGKRIEAGEVYAAARERIGAMENGQAS